MNLRDFISSNLRSQWIDEPGLSYYVRKSIFFPGSIELANCGADPDSREFGYWRFLKRYAREIPFIAEQVINPDLASLYRRLRWRERDIGGIPQFASPLMVERFCDEPCFRRLYPE